MSWNRLFVLLQLIVNCSAAVAQHLPVQLDSFYNALDADRKINGNVLIAEGTDLIYEKSFGFAGLTPQIPNAADTRFNMASVSKPFTAVAIFQLIEKKELHLDDKLSRYFPDFPFESVTIRHLLSHTSGLPNTEALFSPLLERAPGYQVKNADLVPELKAYAKPLQFSPGEKYEYCNTGFSLLALLVEKLSGEKFPAYLKKHIFLPAGMLHSSVGGPPGSAGRSGTAVNFIRPAPYSSTLQPVNEVPVLRKWTFNWSMLYGQGNIYATGGDMLLFDRALFSGKLVSPGSLNQMFSPVKLNNGSIPYFRAGIDEASYGLGWFIYKHDDGGKVVWHSGGIPGMNSFFLHNLKTGQVIVTTDNAGNATIAPETYLLLSGKSFVYKRSLALIYARLLLEQGIDQASSSLAGLRNDQRYVLSEGELNFLGLRLFEDGYTQLGMEALKVNALLFPESFNVYDSYGEVLLKTGNREAAKLMYQKSVNLNPKNEGGLKALRQLANE
nr:serine hydrolase domain-containing protein [Hufsiella ginkgonis]